MPPPSSGTQNATMLKGNSTLKATQSATAFKAAAAATLNRTQKGPETFSGTTGYNDLTMRSPYQGDKTMKAGMVKLSKPIETVWDDEPEDLTGQKRKLKSLAGKVDRMANVFEEETQSRAHQRELMDELHNDQIKRLDEIGQELDQAMAEVKAKIEEFMQRYRRQLSGTFEDLHEELQAWVDKLTPQMAALEARGRVLRAAIDEEREARLQHNAAILVPAKEWCRKLKEGILQEQMIRQARAAEIQKRMEEASDTIEKSIDAEIAARNDRQTHTAQDWQREQERLQKRQLQVEESCDDCIKSINEDGDSEYGARISAQDPIVQALTRFMQQFHADIKEKAEMG